MASASSSSDRKFHSGAPPGGRPATPPRTARRPPPREEAHLERQAAHDEVPREGHLCADDRRVRPRGDRRPRGAGLPGQSHREQQARDRLPDDVGHRAPVQAEVGCTQQPVHQERTEHGAEAESGRDVVPRAAGVADAAHPPVAGHAQQDEGHTAHGDPHPSRRLVGDGAVGGDEPHDRPGERAHGGDDEHPHPHGEPRGRHPLAHRGRTITAPEPSSRPRRRPIGQEGELSADHPEDHGSDAERREGFGPEPADDGEILHEVQRLGDQDDQRREGESSDRGEGGVRRAHAVRNEATTSSTGPVNPNPAACG